MDTFRTLQAPAEAKLTEKRSRFLAFVHPVADEQEVKTLLERYRKEYYDARHVCYAYALGTDGSVTRSNDDGEPSGTAGKPMLGQILSRGLTFTLAVVVRYFGGVKLGTGPLGVAYKTAAAEALDAAPVVEKTITATFHVAVPYADADTAMRFVREAGAEIIRRDFDELGCTLTVEVRKDDEHALRARLTKIHTAQLRKE